MMTVIRHEIPMKELIDPESTINTQPEAYLTALGFDPDGVFVWLDDNINDVRIITQEVED